MPKLPLKTLSQALRLVAWLAILLTLLAFAQFLFDPNTTLGLPTTDDTMIWVGKTGQLSLADRLLVLLAAGFPTLIWLYALTRMLAIAKRVSRGAILVTANCHSLAHFSIALLTFGITGCLSGPLAALVLEARGYASNINYSELFEWTDAIDLAAAAILLWLLAQILLHAVALREENELTI